MESREEIRARLRAASDNLTRYATAYRALEHRDFDAVYPLVMGYIRDRFLLTKEMCRSDRLLELADVSLRYMLELKRMGIDPGEISRSCSGASSVITKKVLLIKAVQEVFDVTTTPEEFANLTIPPSRPLQNCRLRNRHKSSGDHSPVEWSPFL